MPVKRLLAGGLVLPALTAPALAQSAPFGMGGAEQSVRPASFGPLAPLVQWILDRQGELYQMFAASMRAVKTDPMAGFTLIGLCFAYGVLHAAGAGHGKAVISSYLLASRESLRRGVMISFASALIQGMVAISLVGVMALVFRASSFAMTRAGQWLEIGSYVLITVMGLLLVVQALRALFPAVFGAAHAADAACCETGHMPPPAALDGPLDGRAMLAAVLAVGLRPCSGAIIVLVFALMQGLFFVGVLGVVAMSLGTGITVSVLAALAVGAKEIAVRLAMRRPQAVGAITGSIRLLAGLLVLAFGASLLAASLSRGGI